MTPPTTRDSPSGSHAAYDGRERRATPGAGSASVPPAPIEPALARRHARQLALLRGVSVQLTHTTTPPVAAQLLLGALAEACGAAWVALYRANPDGTFSRRATRGALEGSAAAPERVSGPAVTRFHDAPEAPVLRGAPAPEGENAAAAAADPATLLGAEMAAPVDDQGSRLGWLAVGPRTDGAAYDATDLRFLALLASFSAARLAHADLVAAYRHASRIDESTGLGNRRAFEERIDEELARANRSGQPMSLLLCEIDDFARFGERHGVDARDRALRTVADAIDQSVRRSDTVFRHGDVRIALIMSNTDVEGARIVAERLRRAVAALVPPAVAVPLTCSVGIGALRGVHKPVSLATLALYRKADEALYRAASRGGDRCVAG